MKHAVAIMAHATAQSTVDDFLPRWRSLEADLYCSIPHGEEVHGFQNNIWLGTSAYSGFHVFNRFLLTLDAMIQTGCKRITIAEYDTVNIAPKLPYILPDGITSYFVLAPGFAENEPVQLCALSPWSMERETAIRLSSICRELLAVDPDYPAGKGLLDRWIGKCVVLSEIPRVVGPDLLGYPWHVGAHDRIKRMGLNWIHGWKKREEFGDLWN